MYKRYCGFFLIITLIFLLIPISFASDNNLTVNEQIIDDNYILKDSSDIHVDVKGSDDNDGSVANPVATIKKAIDISTNHSKIIIHEGTYKENNLNITKSLDIISQGNVVVDAENSSRIFTINTKTSDDNVLLSGITFINGKAYQGGAIYIRNAVTTIDNSKFAYNTALAEGGAIYWNALNGKLTNTIVEQNTARDGAGVSWGGSNEEDVFGVESDYGDIINCTFENNHIIHDDDGCIGLSIYSDYVNVVNSKFINHNTNFNTSFEVVYINGDYGIVSNCLFENNTLTMTGALGLDGNFAQAYNNVFINNTMSFDDSFGGAIGIQSENADIHDNTFISNGGATGVGGAVFINTIETFSFNFINITNNVFENNFAYFGGGIYTTGKSNMLSLVISNNTFKGENSFNGSAIYLTDIYNPVVIENNNFTGLIAGGSGEIYASHCILLLANNLVENCSSENGGFIFTDGEVRSPVYLKFRDVTGIIGQPTTLVADLFDDMNNTISTMKISFTLNGENVNGKKGLNRLTLTPSARGVYDISGSFDSPKLSVENGILTINKGAILKVSNITNYGKNVVITITLTDDNLNPLSGKDIVLSLDGFDYLLTTDSNGVAKFSKDMDYKNYIATALFDDDEYNNISSLFSIKVLSSIDAIDMKRAYNSDYDFTVTLLNRDGAPLKGEDITFLVNDKAYSVKTDEKGTATLTNFDVGLYVVSITNPATDESVNRNFNIVKRITGNANINMYYGASKYYKVRIYTDDGEIAGAGENVTFKINGKTYTRQTNSEGYASYKITQSAKTYTITATYKGVKVSNKVVVKPVLTAKNISKKKAKTIKFQAKLVNTNGKALKNKKITFKIKGKTYTAKTNSKGIATLSLKNLKVGKYTITSKYSKSTIKNTIQIKK
ncbi:Ig-like domain-containing protein [Methanobrevibacter sp.]|uniref:Ig-like domain-containing protein n=1 Tax=Methanobrevibacter sp. TaxID=66852 RepID=UPI00386F04DF